MKWRTVCGNEQLKCSEGELEVKILSSKFIHFSSVAQSCSTHQPHGLHHARLPCPSPTRTVYSNSCALSRWCHPTISSFVIPFSSCPQSFPAPESFPRSQLFTSGGQHIGASASASVLPVNIQGWFLLGLTGLISSSYLLLTKEQINFLKKQFYNAVV